MPQSNDNSPGSGKSIKDMSPVEYFWAHQRKHQSSKAEESKSGTAKGKKKGVKVPLAIIKAQSVPVGSPTRKTPAQYVIPVPDVSKPSKPVKKGKAKPKAPKEKEAAPANGIKLVKDLDALKVNMPEFKDYRLPENQKPIEKIASAPKPSKKKGTKVKKAPINIGSTRIV
jgi:hypothetical protein